MNNMMNLTHILIGYDCAANVNANQQQQRITDNICKLQIELKMFVQMK